MFKKKSFFITFEGIEGSGKSFQSKKLYGNIKKKKLPVILTREPGGTKNAEKIRKVILDDYFHPNSKEEFEGITICPTSINLFETVPLKGERIFLCPLCTSSAL